MASATTLPNFFDALEAWVAAKKDLDRVSTQEAAARFVLQRVMTQDLQPTAALCVLDSLMHGVQVGPGVVRANGKHQ